MRGGTWKRIIQYRTIQYITIRELRYEIIRTIENYIAKYLGSLQKFAISGEKNSIL